MLLRVVTWPPVIDLDRQSDGAEYMTFGRPCFEDWYAAPLAA
jgi:hypothetical protein